MRLGGADLRDAELSGVDLRRADLRDAQLAGAALAEADLFRADLAGADLAGAVLDRADLRESGLSGTVFAGARLRDANLAGASANSGDTGWRGADLREARLAGTDLRGADLRDADLSGADLENADLSAADLRGANLTRVGVGWASFFGHTPGQRPGSGPSARFDDADLGGAALEHADLVAASFAGARLTAANLAAANLAEASLVGADAAHAVLHGADLTGADLRNAGLREADLRDAVLIGARLQHTDLRSARLAGAWFGATVLIDAALTAAAGLAEVRPVGPTWLDDRTAARAGAGMPEFAAACRGLAGAGDRAGSAASWLVAVESPEDPFGRYLVGGLRRAGVACWAVPPEALTKRARYRATTLLGGTDGVIYVGGTAPDVWMAATLGAPGPEPVRLIRVMTGPDTPGGEERGGTVGFPGWHTDGGPSAAWARLLALATPGWD